MSKCDKASSIFWKDNIINPPTKRTKKYSHTTSIENAHLVIWIKISVNDAGFNKISTTTGLTILATAHAKC